MDQESQPRNRRKDDNCWLRRFWGNWGPHIDISGYVVILSMIGASMVSGYNFISDTRAAIKMAKNDHTHFVLSVVKSDRMNRNIETIMTHMRLEPEKKSDTEIMMERKVSATIFSDESQSTNDNEAR